MIISLAVGYATITNGGFPGRTKAFAAPVTGLAMPAVSSSAPATNHSAVLRAPAINKTGFTDQPITRNQSDTLEKVNALLATPTAQPAVVEDAVVRAAVEVQPIELPPYTTYQVQENDNVSVIANKFGINPEYVLANNPEIHDSDFLKLGQWLIIPAGNGILHEVRYGDTLSDIATRYDVDVQAIIDFRANNIASPDDIIETQLVFVPNGRVLPAAPVAEPFPDVEEPVAPAPEATPVPNAPPPPSSGGDVVSAPVSGGGLIWPVNGPVSSYYGPSHPLGIDIDGFNLAGAAIAAATSGTVVFAGGNACCSYGLYVVIMSPGGIETLYAHLSSISVVQGQTVSQGETIGIIGSTGYSTGRHLHFEVIDNGVRRNPLSYLP